MPGLRRWLNHSGLGLLSPLLILLLAVFVAPVLLMFPTSLRPYTPGVGIGDGWTLTHYAKILGDSFYLTILARTIGLGLTVTLLTLVVGYPLAYFMARTRSRFRHWLLMLVIFPLLLNLVVRSFGWITLLANRGLVNELLTMAGLLERPLALMFNFTGLLIGLTHIFLPFMVLVLVSTLQNIRRDLEDAAAVLGANRIRVFIRVILPLSVPGILSGGILVFVLTISALVTPKLLGGPTYKVMSTMIYDQFLQLLNWPLGSAMAFVLTVLTLVLIALSSILARRWVPAR